MMVNANLARLRCPVAWSNNSLDVAVKVTFKWINIWISGLWVVYPPEYGWTSPNLSKTLKAKTEVFFRIEWILSLSSNIEILPEFPVFRHNIVTSTLSWISSSSVLSNGFQTCSCNHRRQFLKIDLSLCIHSIYPTDSVSLKNSD